jgi:hypothetical protein
MGTSAPHPVVARKTGTVPDCGRVLAAGGCPQFSAARKVFQSPDYKEEQLRAEFLNPFFESLGWDVANKAGLTEVYKPVIHEESIKVAGATKAPDYTFRIGGRRVR